MYAIIIIVGVMLVNKRGQALVEFVIILPILVLLIFTFLDFGRILLCKMHLENTMDSVTKLVYEGKNVNSFLEEDNDYKISYEIKSDEYPKIILKTKLELITPGLKNILHNPYTVVVERSILDE